MGREPWVALVPLALLQWAAIAIFAASVRHNGWLFYQGGDQTWYYTTSSVLADWRLPETPIGFGWSLLLLPVALLVGPDVLAALPAVILLQVLVLGPLALFCVYGIASRIGGRALGYAAATLWVFAPFAAIPLFDDRYHERYVEQFLPGALGLTGLADFPSTVALLLAAYLTLRTLETRAAAYGVLAGLVAGFAIGIKPSNGLFLAAPLLAFAVARRFREAALFGAALLPALLTLALWKERGLGYLPAFALSVTASGPVAALGPIDPYVDIDWSVLGANLDGLREYFWSARLLEWLPIAGAVGVARRSLPAAAMLAAWLAAFLVVKGTTPLSTVDSGSFFRLLMPAFPAFLLLAVAVPLLVPTFGRRLAERFAVVPAPAPKRGAVFFAALVVLTALPLVFLAVVPPLDRPLAVKDEPRNLYVPITAELLPTGRSVAGGVQLSWPAAERPERVFYRVLRGRSDGVSCGRPAGAPLQCRLAMAVVATTRDASFVDRPPRGRWVYRIGRAANWTDDPALGDVLALGQPLTVTR